DGISAATSTVIASSPTVSTDSGNTGTITVTVKDGFGNPVSGAPVALSQGGGHTVVSPSSDGGATGSGTTNAAGVASFAVSDSTTETVTFSATASGTLISQTAAVTFTSGADDHLHFVVQPSMVGAGQTMTPAVK